MLEKFGKLPNDPVVKDMTELDYLYCYIHMTLDDESAREECAINENFDHEKYKRKCGAY